MNLAKLEIFVLKYFWQIEATDGKQVYVYFEKQRAGMLNTAQSTLDHLFKNGLLKRNKESHAFSIELRNSTKHLLVN